jgi:hypothetical protein
MVDDVYWIVHDWMFFEALSSRPRLYLPEIPFNVASGVGKSNDSDVAGKCLIMKERGWFAWLCVPAASWPWVGLN